MNFFTKLIITFIKLYQKIISKDHGLYKKYYPYGYCKYYPSCSEFAKQSLEKFGFFKGLVKAIYRILRCNPFSKGGIDNP